MHGVNQDHAAAMKQCTQNQDIGPAYPESGSISAVSEKRQAGKLQREVDP